MATGNLIEVFNQGVSDAINKADPFYEAFVGAEEFTPELTIVTSADFNCGAICNELEFVRFQTNILIDALKFDTSFDDELDTLINTFIDLPRQPGESNNNFRNKFRFIATQRTNPRRTTRGAILDALSYYVAPDKVDLIEFFDFENLRFHVRFEGTETLEDALFLDDPITGYLDINFVGGAGVGVIVTFIGNLINRIKAAGVEAVTEFIEQFQITKTSNARIGSVAFTKSSSAVVRVSTQITKTSNAAVV